MESPYTIPALAKTFTIIEYISQYPEGVTFMEIVNELNVPKSSVYKILHTLEKEAWIEKTGTRYKLGYMMIHYGMLTLSRRNISKVAHPFLENLMNEVGETTHLAVLSGTKSMFLDICERREHIKLSFPIGSLFPLYRTSHGKIFLAYCIKKDLKEFIKEEPLIKKTDYTIVTLDNLYKEIETIKKNGYSLDNRECFDDIRCCAAPIFGNRGQCIAAVGITSTIDRFPTSRLKEISAKVKKTALSISKEMGYIPKEL